MKRLTLYLFRHLAVATVFVTAGLTLVIWLTQSLRLLEIVVDGGAPVYLFLQLMVVTLPTFLSIVLPISLLAAVLFTYNRLTMDSELVVMRSAGMGPWGLAKPALILALLVTMIGYGLTLYLAPVAHRELSRLESLARSEFSTVFLREGVFNEAGDGVTVYVRRRMPDGELQGLLIHDTRVPGKPVTINADRGMTVEGEAGTRVVVFDGNRQEVDLATGRMSQLYFDRYAVDLRIFEKQFAERVPDARERSTADLMHAADDPDLLVERAGEAADDHRHQRVLDIDLQLVLDVPGQLGRRLARRLQVLDQRGRDPAVGTHRDRDREFRALPHIDLDRVERPDAVVGRGRLLDLDRAGGRRVVGGRAGRQAGRGQERRRECRHKTRRPTAKTARDHSSTPHTPFRTDGFLGELPSSCPKTIEKQSSKQVLFNGLYGQPLKGYRDADGMKRRSSGSDYTLYRLSLSGTVWLSGGDDQTAGRFPR